MQNPVPSGTNVPAAASPAIETLLTCVALTTLPFSFAKFHEQGHPLVEDFMKAQADSSWRGVFLLRSHLLKSAMG